MKIRIIIFKVSLRWGQKLFKFLVPIFDHHDNYLACVEILNSMVKIVIKQILTEGTSTRKQFISMCDLLVFAMPNRNYLTT